MASGRDGASRPDEGDEVEELVRGTIEALLTRGLHGTALRDALHDAGWDELVAEHEALAVTALFEGQGRHLSASAALDDVVARTLGRPAAPVAFPFPPAAGVPSSTLSPDGTTVDVDAVLVGHGAGQPAPLVVPAHRGELTVLLLDVDPASLTRTPIGGIDPDLGLVRLSGRASTFGAVMVDDAGATRQWAAAVAAARRALASELVGAARAILDLATTHVKERVQFGKPIGVHQGVKFRLADAYVAVSAAALVIDEAWATPAPDTSDLAKAAAGHGGLAAIEHGHQVMGAMGFTWEFPMHRFSRRIYALDALLGGAASIDRERGRRMVAAGTAPRTGEI